MIQNKQKIGERIRKIRTDNNWNIQTFSEIINSSKSNISYWENGKSLPRMEKIEFIAKIGNMKKEEILYGSEEEAVKDFFEAHGVKLEEDEINKIVERLKEKEINVYENSEKEIIKAARAIKKELTKNTNFVKLAEKYAIKSEVYDKNKKYKIEQDEMYREEILPVLDKMFSTNKEKNELKKEQLLNAIEFIQSTNHDPRYANILSAMLKFEKVLNPKKYLK